MPTCKNCERRGVECHFEVEYVEPKKRGRKPRKNKEALESIRTFAYEPYPIQKNIHSPNPDFSTWIKINKSSQEDMCFEEILRQSPLCDRDRVQLMLNFANVTEPLQLTKFGRNVPTNEEMAFFFACKAMHYRKVKSSIEVSELIHHSRKYIIESYDNVFTSFTIACTYYFLGCYYFQDNILEKAQFYFENAQKFINQWNNRTIESTPEGQLSA